MPREAWEKVGTRVCDVIAFVRTGPVGSAFSREYDVCPHYPRSFPSFVGLL